MFAFRTRVRLHHTDAAGLLFYGNIFMLAHDAYEEFLQTIDLSVADLLKSEFILPIVHAEADYRKPIGVGKTLMVSVDVLSLGKTSFVLGYRFSDTEDTTIATAQTVHVSMSIETRKKIDLPETLAARLKNLIGHPPSDMR
jgi:1,4-dihydroxy-2-naphthoyl-CoA hydrolase